MKLTEIDEYPKNCLGLRGSCFSFFLEDLFITFHGSDSKRTGYCSQDATDKVCYYYTSKYEVVDILLEECRRITTDEAENSQFSPVFDMGKPCLRPSHLIIMGWIVWWESKRFFFI